MLQVGPEFVFTWRGHPFGAYDKDQLVRIATELAMGFINLRNAARQHGAACSDLGERVIGESK